MVTLCCMPLGSCLYINVHHVNIKMTGLYYVHYAGCQINLLTFVIDSHHKLIKWRIVTHGCIDGYSRLITFLRCSGNNQASTVYQLFIFVVEKYHLPSRIRTDQGGENVLVAQHMLEKRGPERNSVIVGASVHNQRIERLWRDMHRCVTTNYSISWSKEICWTL